MSLTRILKHRCHDTSKEMKTSCDNRYGYSHGGGWREALKALRFKGILVKGACTTKAFIIFLSWHCSLPVGLCLSVALLLCFDHRAPASLASTFSPCLAGWTRPLARWWGALGPVRPSSCLPLPAAPWPCSKRI